MQHDMNWLAKRSALVRAVPAIYRPVIAALILCSLAAFAFVVFRVRLTNTPTYVFLCWNLFLAWVPLGFAVMMESADASDRRGWKLALFGAAWLAFYPNAPYIVTDLMHLTHIRPDEAPLWFDSIMIMGFAAIGLLVGFLSLSIVHQIVSRRWGSFVGWSVVVFTQLLTGFGIYLGRFQRFNSWDILGKPGTLFMDIAGRLMSPIEHSRTTGVTLGMGTFLVLGYVTLIALTRMNPQLEKADHGR